jgi:uncharacterized protein involved in tolerance to divalent cations
MVTLMGGGASTYTWDNSVMDNVAFVPSATTTYNVTGTDGNGCMNTASVMVTVNALPTVTATASASAVCTGDVVTLMGGGASTYTWDNSVTDNVAFVPTATTTYNVTGTDGNGCVNTASVTVTVNTLPTVTASASATTLCAGDMVTLMGGGAVSYTWDNSVVDNTPFAATTATTMYTVTGTDANGCMDTEMIMLTVNSLPPVTATTGTSVVCEGDMVTLIGGGALTYVWDNSVTDNVPFAATTTTLYHVVGTDANGCSNVNSYLITVNPLPTVTASASATTLCEGDMVTLMGGGAVSYTWDNSVTDNVAFAATPATTMYTVTGTDANGCMDTEMIMLTVNALPAVTATASASAVCAGDMVTLMGGGASTYTWDNSVVDGAAFVPTATTLYTVTGTDVNGCMNTASTTVTVNALPTVTATASSSTVCAGDMVTLMGGGASTYAWDNSVVDNTPFAATATTTYNVIGTDVNGCTGTASTTVTVNALPSVTFTSFATDTLCVNYAPVTLTGGSPAGGVYSGTGVTAGSFNPSVGVGVYSITYTVTDANSCSNSSSQNLTVDACTGIEEGIASADVTVYPNPNNGMFNIAISNSNSSEVMISIVDIQGKEVYNSLESNVGSQFTKEINLQGLAKGMYYIKLSTNSSLTIKKVSVN